MQAAVSAASAPPASRRLRAELGEGLAFTWRQPFLRYSAFFAASVNILLQVLTLGLIVLARHDGASSAQIGLIVGCMGAGGLAGAFAVSVQTYRMHITPNELLGRTSSVALQIAWGVIPLGSLLAGFLLQALSPAAVITVVAAGMAVTALAATALAPVRDAGRRTPGASGPAAGAAAQPAS